MTPDTGLIREGQWPTAEFLLEVSRRFQIAEGGARCLSLAVCHTSGEPARRFEQGEIAQLYYGLYYGFEALRDSGVPAGGAELVRAQGILAHGKAVYHQTGTDCDTVLAGARARFHQFSALRLAVGCYGLNLRLASVESLSQGECLAGAPAYLEFASCLRDQCRQIEADEAEVVLGPSGWLSRQGLTDLPGLLAMEIVPGETAPRGEVAESIMGPAALHVTHRKAATHPVQANLRGCFSDFVVKPRVGSLQVLHYAIQHGFVYSTVYLSESQEVILAYRLEAQASGCTRGIEDVTVHQRKGVAGDWRNHFTGRINRAFKARYDRWLVATSYEKDLDW